MRDKHRETAAKIFGVPEDQITDEQWSVAKTINYGRNYGMSAFRLQASIFGTPAGKGKGK